MSLKRIIEKLSSLGDEISNKKVVTGFDGFVDEMITVVDQRQDPNNYERVESIEQFGKIISSAAGHSSLREIVVTQTDPGGCAINMGDGLASLGVKVDTFATVGEPMHGAFSEYAQKAKVHSWGREPGRTLAYEFADGKLMHSSVSQLAEFTPNDLAKRLANGEFEKSCNEADLIALTDWTLFPYMTDCWNYLQEKVFSKLIKPTPFFIDLVDPVSRSKEDIVLMIKSLKGFLVGGPVTLGLNQNEANILSQLTGGSALEKPNQELAIAQAEALRTSLEITEVVIHAVDYAVLSNETETANISGPYCAKPIKLTGAGDRFNAGYTLGFILGLNSEDRLFLAAAASGLYVRLGRSASMDELKIFLTEWQV